MSCGCYKKLVNKRRLRTSLASKDRAARNMLWHHYRTKCAQARGHVFEISKEAFNFLTKQLCFYCGAAPATRWYKARYSKNASGRKFQTPYEVECFYNGLDRVDNSKGYIYANVVPCCPVCNRAKRDMQQSEFLAWAIRLAKNLKLLTYAENI